MDPYTRLTREWKINVWVRENARLQEESFLETLFSSWAAFRHPCLTGWLDQSAVAEIDGLPMGLPSSSTSSSLSLIQLQGSQTSDHWFGVSICFCLKSAAWWASQRTAMLSSCLHSRHSIASVIMLGFGDHPGDGFQVGSVNVQPFVHAQLHDCPHIPFSKEQLWGENVGCESLHWGPVHVLEVVSSDSIFTLLHIELRLPTFGPQSLPLEFLL